MAKNRYSIDECGYVFKGRRRLGHISNLLHSKKTTLSKSVRRWWYDNYLPSVMQLARVPTRSVRVEPKAEQGDTIIPSFPDR